MRPENPSKNRSPKTGAKALGYLWCWLVLALMAVQPVVSQAAAPALLGKTGWTAVMFGAAKDPQGDSQAGAADTDIIADATHGSLYVGFDDNGTISTADDGLYFRLRIDNPTDDAPATFSGVAVVGIDADLDGDIDMFLTVDGRSSSQVVRLMDPGTGANISPNTTTTTPLPTGWLPSGGVYSFTTALYQAVAVSITTDPHWSSDNDLGNQGGPDIFVSWKIPMDDLATVLAIPSPVDRNGVYGPRGATGVTGYTKDTLSQYVAFTQTQSGPINGDLNGVGGSYDKNATFASLGTFTAPMSAANPVSASDAVTISDPVDANGYINATEDNSVTVNGTTTPVSSWVKLTATDGSLTVTNWVQANGSGAWTASINISTLAEGTITFTAELVTGNNSTTLVANSSGDTTTAIHDTVPPVIGITPLFTSGKPTISGTSSGVPAGSVITVAIDPNGDGILTDQITYSAVVDSSGNWSVNTAVVSPTSGTMPSAGLTSYAAVTASGSDAAGNSTTTTGVTRPTVNAITTNDTTPVISGTWGGINGGADTLKVIVNGVTYTQGDGNLVVSGTTWTLTIPGGNALTTGLSPYDITTRVTRNAIDYDNTTNDILAVVSGPAVSITSSASQPDTTPLITGTSTILSGFITVRIDPNNDGNLTDAITYSVATGGGGAWSLDTDTAVPLSGTYPLAGITGAMGILVTATDGSGVTVTASQTLTVTIPTITITQIFTTATPNSTGTTNTDFVINRREDDAISVKGTSTSAVGLTVTVTVSDGDGGTTDPSGTATVAGDGTWTVAGLDLSALRNGYLTFTAAVTGASDIDTSYTHDGFVPVIRFTTASTLDKNSGSAGETVSGTSDLAVNSIITVQYGGNGSTNATVLANGDWSVTPNFALTGSTITVTATPDVNATDSAGNKPAAARSKDFDVSASFVPTTGAVVINTVATDNIIDNSEAAAVTITGTSTIASGTVTLTVTNALGTQVLSTNISYTGGVWSSFALNFSSTTPNGPLIIMATTVSASITYTDAIIATLQLGTVGAGSAPTITIATVGDANLSASEDNTVTVAGTTTSVSNGNTVSITISDTDGGTANVTGTATVDGSGNWTTSLNLSTLIDGALTASVSVTEGVQTATDNATVYHDIVAQALAITSGPSAGDSTPVISGTSGFSVGTVLTVSIDSDNNGVIDVTYSVTVQTGGTWSVDTGSATPATGTFPSSGLSASATVVVSGADAAGNTSTISSTSITAISSDNGVSTSDFITNDQTLIFSGKGLTNGTVEVFLNAVSLGTTSIDASGNWTFNHTGTTLAAGTYSLTATVTAVTGVTSTGTQSFTIDTTAPAAATVAISGDTGTSGVDYKTQDNTLVYSGTADANGSVQVTLKDSGNNTIFTTTVTADGSGNWTIDRTGSTLPDGTYTLTVVTTDGAGNTTTTNITIVIDTSAEITITTNATTSDATPLITGTTDIETGRTITVDIDANNNGLYDDGAGHTYTATVQSGGTWSVEATTTLSNTNNVRAIGTDTAGNSATATKVLIINASAPTLTITEPIGDGNLNATEDNSVTIQGTSTFVPNGSTISVTITDGTTTISDTTTVSANAWSLAPFNLSSLDNGVITVTVTYTDTSGSSFSDTATVLHDKSGTTTIDGIGTDTALISDFITKDTTLTFSGAAGGGSGASVILTLTNSAGATVFTTTVTADGDGNWSYTYVTALTNDVYGLTADSGTTATQNLTVDTIAPTGPVTANTQTTTDTTPVITGTATVGAGETLTVTINGVTYTAGDGNLVLTGSNWTLTIPPGDALDPSTGNGGFDGDYTVTATVTDTAGNTLTSTSTITVTVFPTLTAATGGGAISADNFGTGTYVTLTGPIYTEGVSGDVGAGTIILTAPAGFEFDTGGVAPTVLVTGSATAADNVNDATTGSSLAVTSVSASQITFTVTAESFTTNTLTWQNIRVRPTAGTPLTTGNITMDAASTAVLTSVVNGTTSLGTLTEVPGTVSGYRITAASGTVAAGSSDQLTIKRVDQYGNTVTNFTGDVSLTFSGLATSAAGNVPTVTDKTGAVINLGSVTSISFTNGVSDLGGLLVAYKAETATLQVTDGTYSTSTTGGSGVALTVTEGAATAYRITAASSTPTAGTTDVLTIRRVDQYGNTVTSLNGDVNLTFSGLATSLAGNVPTITDKTATAINQATATTITFTGGVATAGGTLIAYKAETATLHVTDGTLTSGGTGGTGAALTVSAGAFDAYRITAASGTPTAGATDALTIRQVDSYGNTVTGFTGDVSLTFSGLGTSNGGSAPTVTDKTGAAITQGTGTTITFTSGVSTAGGVLIAYKAETATLHVTDGTNTSSDSGGTGATLTVSGTGTANAYRITAATTTPNAGAADALTIRQVDQYGNTVTTLNGDVSLTFSGLGSVGGNVPTVTSKTGSAINQGTATVITFTSGVSTAGGSLVAYKAETATLHATDGVRSTSTTGGSGVTLTISGLAVSRLGFSTQPDKAEVGAVFLQQPVVQTQDAYGNPTTSGLGATVTVTITITAGSGTNGTLSGVMSTNIGTGGGNGSVTFTDLMVGGANTAGTGNQLTAAGGGFTDGLSSLFDLWTIYMAPGDVIVADRGPYFSTGTILISRVASAAPAVVITSIKDPYEVAREADGNFVVVDYETTRGGGLFRIDRLTFAITTVSIGDKFDVPFGVKVETKAPNAGQILVADLDAFSQAGAVFRVDPVTGAQTTLTQGGNFYFLQGLAIAPTGTPNDGDIYVTSVGDGASITSKLIKIDPATGTQTVVTDGGNLDYPVGMAIESDGNILVVDALAKKVIRVTPAGVQTVLSDATDGNGPAFLLPTHVALDAAGDLYVSDGKVNAGTAERLLFKVNRTTGARTIITQDGFFEQPRGLLLIP